MTRTPDHELIDRVLDHMAAFMRLGPLWHTGDFLTLDVTMPQAKLLQVVSAEPELSLSGLAHRLGVGLPTCSGLVDRLVDQGLVERREDPLDRRQVHIAPTAEGAARIDRLRELDFGGIRHLLAQLSHAELAGLEMGVAALLDRATAYAAPWTAAQHHERIAR